MWVQLSYSDKEVFSFSVQVFVIVCVHSRYNKHNTLNLATDSPGEAEQTGNEAEQLGLWWSCIDQPYPINQSDCRAAVRSLPIATA